MRNDKAATSKKIIELISNLAYFELADLSVVKIDKNYLKVLLSRLIKKEKIAQLKKGMYVSKDYLDKIQKEDIFSDYYEFIANLLYKPSYLSLEYVLYENNILTESPKNFTSICLNKTNNFSNNLGNFYYHKIKKELFTGFNIYKKSDFSIFKASKAKALFDFLYLRKNILIDSNSIKELRLNLKNFKNIEKKELKKYIFLEKSNKMKMIFDSLF
ncbi:MAG: hypothetical protein AB1465_06360 [Patescibacteria group bacterium]